jgi:hypothetical protein
MKSSLSYYERDGKNGSTWTYHLAWYENGKRKQTKKGGFPSKRSARLAGEAKEQEMAAQGWRSETTDTLSAWLETWLDSLAVIGRKRSTIAGYRRTLKPRRHRRRPLGLPR